MEVGPESPEPNVPDMLVYGGLMTSIFEFTESQASSLPALSSTIWPTTPNVIGNGVPLHPLRPPTYSDDVPNKVVVVAYEHVAVRIDGNADGLAGRIARSDNGVRVPFELLHEAIGAGFTRPLV